MNKLRFRSGQVQLRKVPVDAATVIEAGDLIWLDDDDAKPASDFTWDTDLATTQEAFATKFLGVSHQQSRAGETAPISVDVSPFSVYEFDAASASYQVGQTLGPDADGSSLMDQQLEAADPSAVPLTDWQDIEQILHFRATQVKDDRIDGDQRPIVAPARQVLVPEKLRGTARSIVHSTEIRVSSDNGDMRFANPLHGTLEVLSSPFIDEQGGSATSDWYLGDFRRQFIWTEIWPVQTFLQRSESEAAFERDVVLRVKARYYGGVSAVDTVFVTKVAGE